MKKSGEEELFRFFKRGIAPLILFEINKSFLSGRPIFPAPSGFKKTNVQVVKNRTIYSYSLKEEFDRAGESLIENIIKDPSLVEKYRSYCDKLYDEALNAARRYGSIETEDKEELKNIFKEFSDYLIKIGGTVLSERIIADKRVEDLLLGLTPIIDENNLFFYMTNLCPSTIPPMTRIEEEELLKVAERILSKLKTEIEKYIENLKERIEKKQVDLMGKPYPIFEEKTVKKEIKELVERVLDSDEELEAHVKKYAWLEMDFGIGRILSKEDFKRKLLKLYKESIGKERPFNMYFGDPKLASIMLNMDYTYLEKRKEKIFEELKGIGNFDKEISPLCKFLATEAHVRLKRRYVIAALYYYLEKHLRKVVDMYNATHENKICYEDAQYLKVDEIISFLNGGESIKPDELVKRKKLIVIDPSHDPPELYGEDAEKYYEEEIKGKIRMPTIQREVLKEMIRKGQVPTLKGKPRGFYGKLEKPATVKILEPQYIFTWERRESPIDEFMDIIRKDDVVVTTMLTPSLITLIAGQVRGVITEEGTITSHAITLSHEFRIPLITDVEGITDILRDGDKVEVNFDTGEIRVIELAEGE